MLSKQVTIGRDSRSDDSLRILGFPHSVKTMGSNRKVAALTVSALGVPSSRTHGRFENRSDYECIGAMQQQQHERQSDNGLHAVTEFLFLDLCPPVTKFPTPVALVARTETFIALACVKEILGFADGIDDEEKVLVFEQLSALPTLFSSDPIEAFHHVSESFSGTLRVREKAPQRGLTERFTLRTLMDDLHRAVVCRFPL